VHITTSAKQSNKLAYIYTHTHIHSMKMYRNGYIFRTERTQKTI